MKMEDNNFKRMQELLPDYVFDKLNSEDKQFFEDNIDAYPELLTEIDDIKSVFAKFDKMDFLDKIDNKTRNTSVRVLEKRGKTKSYNNYSSFGFLTRFALPMAIMITLALVYINNNFVFDNKAVSIQEDVSLEIEDNVKSIFDSSDSVDIISYSENSDNNLFAADDIEMERLTNKYQTKINEALDITNTGNIDQMDDVYYIYSTINPVAVDELDEINEDDFKIIYEELKNVKVQN